ncbi:MAG: LAGLIDADG family homing endonuclease [Nitrososphaerota archaeon]
MQKKLPLEVKEKLMEAIRTGAAKGYGYHRIWKMLKESDVEVSKSTVRNYYYKRFSELKRRGRCLPRELRIKLYQKVLELRREGLGYKKIKKKIEELYNVSLSISTISYWCRNICSPYNGIRIPSIDFLEPSPELSQVIGTVAGDGWVKKKDNEYRVGVESKDIEFIEEVSICFGKILGREPPKPIRRKKNSNAFMVEVESKALYELLRKPLDINRIAPFVEHCEECMRRFARSFFDSEGCVSKDGQISCCNSDLQLLQYVRRILNILGIRTTEPKICTKKGTALFDRRRGKTYTAKKDVYYTRVVASDVLRFYRLVGFTVKRKQKRLEEYLRKRGLL